MNIECFKYETGHCWNMWNVDKILQVGRINIISIDSLQQPNARTSTNIISTKCLKWIPDSLGMAYQPYLYIRTNIICWLHKWRVRCWSNHHSIWLHHAGIRVTPKRNVAILNKFSLSRKFSFWKLRVQPVTKIASNDVSLIVFFAEISDMLFL